MSDHKRKLHKNENGLAIVEAAIILPLCIIMVMAVYYAAIFMAQKANMQANLQNAAIYYKNIESDTYVEAKADMAYVSSGGTIDAVGSAYGKTDYLFPYRFLTTQFDRDARSNFESFFRSMSGYMFFDTGDNIELEVPAMNNYIVYKYLTVSAKQTVKPAISLALVGLPDEFTISTTARVTVTDPDDFIRNIDFAVDLLRDTKIGEMATNIASKISEIYQKFTDKFTK